MAHIFISYAKIDTRPLAEELFRLINEMDGFSAWMDSSLEPASSWANQIQREILKADLVLVLLSTDVNREESETQRRSFVLNEIDFAQQVNKRILPIMAQQTFVPVQIAGLEYVDLTKNKAQGLKRLYATIERSYGNKKASPVQPQEIPTIAEVLASPAPQPKPLEKNSVPQFSVPLLASIVIIGLVLIVVFWVLANFLNNKDPLVGNEPTRSGSPTEEANLPTEQTVTPTDPVSETEPRIIADTFTCNAQMVSNQGNILRVIHREPSISSTVVAARRSGQEIVIGAVVQNGEGVWYSLLENNLTIGYVLQDYIVLGTGCVAGEGVDATDEATVSDNRIGFWNQCASPRNLPSSLHIGAIFSLTGNIAVYGISQRQAVEIAVHEINEGAYLGDGNQLLVNFEDAPDVDTAISAMNSLLEEDVLAILGPTLSSFAFAADPAAQENQTVVLGVSTVADGITDMGNYIFRNSLPENAVIPGTIVGSVEAFGISKVAILYADDTDFTIKGYEVFVQALDANAVEVLGQETFASGDTNFNAQLTNLIALNPDAILVSALAAEAIEIISQARTLGYTGHIIGNNGFNSPSLIENAGEAAEGIIVGTAWHIDSANITSQAFVEAYRNEYGYNPDQFAVQAYTGAWLLATAIRCADSVDHRAIRESLAEIRDFNSPLGLFSFDENRNAVHAPIVQIVEDGKFTILRDNNR